MSTEAKCECRHCGGYIMFEVEGFQPGTVIECPHCGEKTARALPFLLANATRVRMAACIVLFIVAAVAIHSHLKTLNEQLDRTGKLMSEGLGDRARANEAARAEAAQATADFNARLKNLTNSDTRP